MHLCLIIPLGFSIPIRIVEDMLSVVIPVEIDLSSLFKIESKSPKIPKTK